MNSVEAGMPAGISTIHTEPFAPQDAWRQALGPDDAPGPDQEEWVVQPWEVDRVEPMDALLVRKLGVLERIQQMDAIPFLAEIPLGIPPQDKEDVGIHEWGHAVVAKKNGYTVRGISLNTTYPVSGVTEIVGTHTLDSYLRTVTAGAAAAGPEGLAGDKSMVAEVAWAHDLDADALFCAYQAKAAADIHSEVPEQSIMRRIGRYIAYKGEVSGHELDALKERAYLEEEIDAVGLTREEVMQYTSPAKQKEEHYRRVEIRRVQRALYDAVPGTTNISTTPEGDAWQQRNGDEIIEVGLQCPVCGLPVSACTDSTHRHMARDRFFPPDADTDQEEPHLTAEQSNTQINEWNIGAENRNVEEEKKDQQYAENPDIPSGRSVTVYP